MFACLECGRKFRSAKSAEKAASNGCPGCGGVDIDIAASSEKKSPARLLERCEESSNAEYKKRFGAWHY